MLIRFAFKSLKTKMLKTVLASIAIILCTTIALVSYNTANQVQDGVISTAGFYDTIIGPEGGPLQLVLSSMFYAGNPLGTIPYQTYEELKNNNFVKEVYPIAAGDSYRTARIIGTVPEYLQRYRVKSGRMFLNPGEVILGYGVARNGFLQLGDEFFGVHGFAESGHVHNDFKYSVVGVLAKTGTAADNAIFTHIKSVWLVHDGHDHDEHGHGHDDHDRVEIKGDIVAAIVRTDSLASHARLISEYDGVLGVQAVNPASVLRELLGNLSLGRDILYVLAVIIMFLTSIIIYVTTTSFAEDSRKDIMVLRLVGIRRKTIFHLFILQMVVIAVISLAASFMISCAALWSINRLTAHNFGIVIDSAKHYPGEPLILLAVFLIIFISAVMSIIPIYKNDPLERK